MNRERATTLAVELMKLGISQVGVSELLSNYDLDEIERQMLYLPHRRAKRPGAFLIEAVRNHYSPPKEFYAQAQNHPAVSRNTVDENTARSYGPLDADTQGHGAAPSLGVAEAISVPLPENRPADDHSVPPANERDWPPVRGNQQGYREPF